MDMCRRRCRDRADIEACAEAALDTGSACEGCAMGMQRAFDGTFDWNIRLDHSIGTFDRNIRWTRVFAIGKNRKHNKISRKQCVGMSQRQCELVAGGALDDVVVAAGLDGRCARSDATAVGRSPHSLAHRGVARPLDPRRVVHLRARGCAGVRVRAKSMRRAAKAHARHGVRACANAGLCARACMRAWRGTMLTGLVFASM